MTVQASNYNLWQENQINNLKKELAAKMDQATQCYQLAKKINYLEQIVKEYQSEFSKVQNLQSYKSISSIDGRIGN